MNLAALDRRVGAEGATDDFAQRLGAVGAGGVPVPFVGGALASVVPAGAPPYLTEEPLAR